ncbi:hypothetical protein F5Y16DRAFT_379000 [Xylariaceae sp. FL0255]|nr:hypothetical protein F5Y16DRAFT_379000 [Xylariaceae sp. FL0255]
MAISGEIPVCLLVCALIQVISDNKGRVSTKQIVLFASFTAILLLRRVLIWLSLHPGLNQLKNYRAFYDPSFWSGGYLTSPSSSHSSSRLQSRSI